MKFIRPYTIVLLSLLCLPFSTLFSQHTIDIGWGITMDIDVSGVNGSSLSEDNYKIGYTSKHSYVSTSVGATVNFGSLISPCESDCWYSGITAFEISLRSITGYNPDGTASGSIDIGKERVTGIYTDNSHSIYMNSGGIPSAVYQVNFIMTGTCARYEDSLLISSPNFSHYVTVTPSLSMATVGDVNEGSDGRDPFSNKNFSWNPSINDKDNSIPFPPGHGNQPENLDDGSGSCGIYGRPEYGVNMQILSLGVNDREYFQSGTGPSVDITRYYRPNHNGIFGKGWKSTLEITADAKTLFSSLDGPVIIKPERGEDLYFTLSQFNKSFTPKGNSDSLYIQGDQLVWMNRQKDLIYTFDTLDASGVFYVTEIRDLFGNKLKYSYVSPGKIASITDDANRIVTLNYNPEGCLASFTTPDGRSSDYEYDAEKRLVNSIDLEGLVSEFEYDEFSNISSIIFEGNKTMFGYQHIAGRSFITSVTDALGNVYTYDLNMWTGYSQNTINYPDGKKVIYHGDSQGNTLGIDDGINATWYTYDTKGRMTSKKLPFYEVEDYEYNNLNQLTKVTYNNFAFELMTYHSSGKPESFTDRYGKVYKLVYNDKNMPVLYINPENDSTRMLYNEKGQLLKIEKPDDSFLEYTYDEFGNINSLKDQQGEIVSLKYDFTGHFVESLTDALGGVVQYEYDNNKRIKSITKPDMAQLNYETGCCGQTGITDENGNTTSFSRNGLNAVTSVNLPGGNSVKLEYDKNNYLTGVTNPAGNKSKIRYSDNSMPLSVVDFQGDSVQYEYNANNMISSVTDERGNKTIFEYSSNFLYSTTDANNKTRYFYRDKGDRVWKIINSRANSSVEYAYDYRGAVVKKTTTDKVYAYNYDKAGRIRSEKSGVDSTSYNFDKRGNLLGIVWKNDIHAEYSYDEVNKLKTMNYPDGFAVSYEYDVAGRITKVKMPKDTVSFSYDSAGKLISEKRSNNTETHNLYDNLGKLTDINHLSMDTVLIGLGYTYNAVGNIIQTDIRFPYSFNFSASDGIDDASYNSLNQLTSENGNTYSYDDDGNLTSVLGPRALTASYTDENLPEGFISGDLSVNYNYNGLQQAVSISKNNVIRLLYYDLQDKLLFETDAEGEMLCKYIYSGNRLTAMADENGRVSFYHFDKNGSTLALTGPAGELDAAYWYSPFGEKLLQHGSLENRFTYIGGLNVSDEGNGFYRMGKRIYDPRNGRFIQRDPKGMVDGTNLYTYAMNNPMVHIDPLGTEIGNGTANLYTCEGPVYGDDFISEETYETIGQVGDIVSDLTPGIGDAKAITKAGYYLYNGEYYKAGMEATSLGIGKYVGGKMAPMLIEKLGATVTKEIADIAIGIAVDQAVKGSGDAASEFLNKPSDPSKSVKNTGPANLMGPPAGIHF